MHERFALNDGLREWITRRSRMDTRPQGQFIAMLPLCMARRRELDETRRHTSARIAANSVINSDRENERWKGGSRRKKIASIFYCSLFLYTLYTIIRRAETYGDRRDAREYLWNNRSPWDEVLFLASKYRGTKICAEWQQNISTNRYFCNWESSGVRTVSNNFPKPPVSLRATALRPYFVKGRKLTLTDDLF